LSPEDFRDAFCVAADAFGRPWPKHSMTNESENRRKENGKRRTVIVPFTFLKNFRLLAVLWSFVFITLVYCSVCSIVFLLFPAKYQELNMHTYETT